MISNGPESCGIASQNSWYLGPLPLKGVFDGQYVIGLPVRLSAGGCVHSTTVFSRACQKGDCYIYSWLTVVFQYVLRLAI